MGSWREGRIALTVRVLLGLLALYAPMTKGAPTAGLLLLLVLVNSLVWQVIATVLIWTVKLLLFGVKKMLRRYLALVESDLAQAHADHGAVNSQLP